MTKDPRIVQMILDTVGYTGTAVIDKAICEPSFGDGEFLLEILQRVIAEGEQSGLAADDLKQRILRNVYGIEKDPELYRAALDRISALLGPHNIHISDGEWRENLICGDTLYLCAAWQRRFDFVVGNPPYLFVHAIPEEVRRQIKSLRLAKDGMIDLYVAFYVVGLHMLKEDGRLCFITPNGFMKNASEKAFRDYLVERQYLVSLYDFKSSRLFPGADTYNCIVLLDKDSNRPDKAIQYREYRMFELAEENTYEHEEFKHHFLHKPWHLTGEEDTRFLRANANHAVRVKDIAVVQNGISTNKNVLYAVKTYEDKELSIPYLGKHSDRNGIVYFADRDGTVWPIETKILHRCVKAGKYDGVMTNAHLIFPYRANRTRILCGDRGNIIDDGYLPLSEEEIIEEYPMAYEYLLSVREELTARDMEPNAVWFQYARSQGLINSGLKKIVFKHIFQKGTLHFKPHVLDADVIVYSGIYTTVGIEDCIRPIGSNLFIFNEELYNRKLQQVMKIFSSNTFAKYCTLTGQDAAGGYIKIATKQINGFGIPPEDLARAENACDIAQKDGISMQYA